MKTEFSRKVTNGTRSNTPRQFSRLSVPTGRNAFRLPRSSKICGSGLYLVWLAL
jgi:hypothetical protein